MKKSILKLICVFATLISCSDVNNTKEDNRILFIVSNADTYGSSNLKAYNHFAEIILAYDEFIKAGYIIDFVSPEGGKVMVGYIDDTSKIQKQYLEDVAFMNLFKTTKSPKEVNASDYTAVYYVGGGAAMFGVPENSDIQNISMVVYEQNNGIVSAICHGSAGLAYLKTKDGKYLVTGKKVNGYPDKFEIMSDPYYATFPFSIEQQLIDNGGKFKYSEKGWDDFSLVDGRLITGQDPTAARSVAKKVIETLNKLEN